MDTQSETNTPVTGGTVIPAPAATGTVVQTGDLAEEWKKRAAGWQTKFQAEQGEKQHFAALAEELQQKITGIASEKDALAQSLQAVTEEKDRTTTELELSVAELERIKIVATEYPTLLPLLKDGAIPDGTGDDLRKKLKILADHIGSAVTGQKQAQVAGATPTPPASTTDTAESVRQEALAAMMKGDYQTYDTLWTRYIGMLKQK